MVGKSAAFYYGLENGRSGKSSRESDGLETCSREKDVASINPPAQLAAWLGKCQLIYTHNAALL